MATLQRDHLHKKSFSTIVARAENQNSPSIQTTGAQTRLGGVHLARRIPSATSKRPLRARIHILAVALVLHAAVAVPPAPSRARLQKPSSPPGRASAPRDPSRHRVREPARVRERGDGNREPKLGPVPWQGVARGGGVVHGHVAHGWRRGDVPLDTQAPYDLCFPRRVACWF